MTITVNYQKRKNVHLFEKFESNKQIKLSNAQNYIPIYDRFFSLNNTNWNSINLNHRFAICDIKDTKHNSDHDDRIFNCKIRDINGKNDKELLNRKVFIKMAPLLDPFKYIIGKYNYTDPNLFNLPSNDKNKIVHSKFTDPNNSSFIDGFFSFLTSRVLHNYNFIHGVDYYGSFLAIKTDYKLNVIDDIEYLVQSDFFNKQKDNLFSIEDYSHLIIENEEKPLKPINISTSLKSVLSVKSFDNDIFENIFDNDNNNVTLSLNDIKDDSGLVDITNSEHFDVSALKKSQSLKSGSSCSSRTSHTDDDDLEDLNDGEVDDVSRSIQHSSSNSLDKNISDNDDNSIYSTESDTSTIEDETLILTLPKFPVQVICMENCEDTLDSLIINEKINEDEMLSALMQVIMILISYQTMFAFTHNDLHTNNIMFTTTSEKYIYYIYKKQTYKVPTFGKIYKIIDFGRSIYKFNNKIFCSDSFKTGGDAATQYNTEPYFNDKKPRLEPNYSFDLCRLACSIYDYVVDGDFITPSNPNNEIKTLHKLITDWCLDDNGINILYKNNGAERYPDFKLYKMIARIVHNHTPQAQLEREEFNKYVLTNKQQIKNISSKLIIDIDKLPSMI